MSLIGRGCCRDRARGTSRRHWRPPVQSLFSAPRHGSVGLIRTRHDQRDQAIATDALLPPCACCARRAAPARCRAAVRTSACRRRPPTPPPNAAGSGRARRPGVARARPTPAPGAGSAARAQPDADPPAASAAELRSPARPRRRAPTRAIGSRTPRRSRSPPPRRLRRRRVPAATSGPPPVTDAAPPAPPRRLGIDRPARAARRRPPGHGVAGGAVARAAAAALSLLLRRRSACAAEARWRPAAAGRSPVAVPADRAAAPSGPLPRRRRRPARRSRRAEPLQVTLEPLRLSLTLMNATLAYRLDARQPRRERRSRASAIGADMISAHASMTREEQLSGPAAGRGTAAADRAARARRKPHRRRRVPPAASRRSCRSARASAALLLPLARFRVEAEGAAPVRADLRGRPAGAPGGGAAAVPARPRPARLSRARQRAFALSCSRRHAEPRGSRGRQRRRDGRPGLHRVAGGAARRAACVVIDASTTCPTPGAMPAPNSKPAHIPGARFLDLDTLVDADSPVPAALPTAEQFAARMAELGVDDGDRVVIYDDSAVKTSARAWFICQHVRRARRRDPRRRPRQVARRRARRSTAAQPDACASAHFTAWPDAGTVRTQGRSARQHRQRRRAAARRARRGALHRRRARDRARACRAATSPARATCRSARCSTPTAPSRTRPACAPAFDEAGIDLDRPVVTTCGSGVTAAVLLFAMHLLGKDDVALYDGSWSEWGADPGTPKATGRRRAR